MSETIASVEVFPVALPRETPYLGPLESGNRPNEKGYFVRPGNSSIYSIHDQSVLVKVTSSGGAVGWGECVGFVGPQVSTAVLTEILGPFVRGRDPHDVVAIYEDCYNLMRVRGFFGGYYHDAIAALDIALWDLRGKLTNLPIRKLLGGTRHERLPAYVSGLPRPTLPERAALAREVIDMGFAAVKFAAAVANEGELAEMRAIREAVGPGVKILALEAIRLIRQLEAYDLYLAEAPVQPEDLEGQAQVAAAVSTSVGIGEELRTVYEYRPRFTARCMNVIQPEMGRTGITSFWHICQMAQAFHCKVMPHASIGVGLFQAASLQASAALTGDMACTAGFFTLPSGPGLGVEPREEVFEHVIRSAA
jgi:L-alanine-DL-glutamate epimerase-like enolase superfamily enzyme